MSEPDTAAGSLAAAVTTHGEAAIVRTGPLTVRTPVKRWSYAASFPIEPVGEPDFVVEAVVRVVEGTVGIGCTGAGFGSVAGQTPLRASERPVRLELVADADHAAHVLVRTWAESAAALVEIHAIRSRALTAGERAAVSAIPALRPVSGWSRYYGTVGDSVAERARVLDYQRLTGPTERRWIEDLRVVVQPDDQLSRALYVSGLYEPNTALVLKRLLEPGATCLDLGAHAGMFTLLGSRFVGASGRVFSFEPSARERARLEEHVALNALANVTVVAAAVGDYDGRATLRIAAAQYGGLNTLGSRFAYDVQAAGSADVEITTLDQFIERARIRRVDVIKLDIEGAECAALRGAAGVLRRLRPALVIEVVSAALQANGATTGELQDLLAAAGYSVYRIDEETAELRRIGSVAEVNEQNIVALPSERWQDELR